MAVDDQLDLLCLIVQIAHRLEADLGIAQRGHVQIGDEEDLIREVERRQGGVVQHRCRIHDDIAIALLEDAEHLLHAIDRDRLGILGPRRSGEEPDARIVRRQEGLNQARVQVLELGQRVHDGLLRRQVQDEVQVSKLQVEIDEDHRVSRVVRECHRHVGREGGLAHAIMRAVEGDDLGVLGGTRGKAALALLAPALLVPHALSGGHHLVTGEGLDEIVACAGLHRLAEVLLVSRRGHDDHAGVGVVGGNALGRLDPIDARHIHVHDHHVGAKLGHPLNGLLAVRRLADHLDLLLKGEDVSQRLPRLLGVIHNQDFDVLLHRLLHAPLAAAIGCRRCLFQHHFPAWMCSC